MTMTDASGSSAGRVPQPERRDTMTIQITTAGPVPTGDICIPRQGYATGDGYHFPDVGDAVKFTDRKGQTRTRGTVTRHSAEEQVSWVRTR